MEIITPLREQDKTTICASNTMVMERDYEMRSTNTCLESGCSSFSSLPLRALQREDQQRQLQEHQQWHHNTRRTNTLTGTTIICECGGECGEQSSEGGDCGEEECGGDNLGGEGAGKRFYFNNCRVVTNSSLRSSRSSSTSTIGGRRQPPSVRVR